MREAGLQRQRQRLGIHMRQHKHVLAARLDGDGRDEAMGIKARREGRAFFELVVGQGFGIGEKLGDLCHGAGFSPPYAVVPECQSLSATQISMVPAPERWSKSGP